MISIRELKFFIEDLAHLDLELIKIYLHFLKNKFLMLGKPDFASEMFSWERYYHHNKKNKNIFKKSDCTKESILLAISELKKIFNKLNCLEVGCGPTSQFYTIFFINKPQIKIISVDPLAEFYKKLHEKYFPDYNIECIAGFGETLTKIFPNNYFHIVYSQNAIDHSQSPIKFIQNMFHILKPNGFMIVYGFINEGTNQNWIGLHKWDLSVENGKLLLSNKKKTYNKYDMINNLNLKLIYKKISDCNFHNENYKSFTLIYQKNL